MTRARFVLGDDLLRQRFDAIRRAVIMSPRDASGLRQEIGAMRAKVSTAHPVKPGWFDVKHSPGSMVDVEFAVQFLVLSCAAEHPALADNIGNIALLECAQACGLLPQGVGHAAADAYRVLRRVQHRARLNEEPTQVTQDTLHAEQNAVLALWRHVFSTAAP